GVVNCPATIYVPHRKARPITVLNTGPTAMAKLSRSMQWLSSVAVVLTLTGPALAQGFDIRSLFSRNPTTASVPPADAAASASRWSGESGASGHPAMQADAIRVAAAGFRSCLEGLWPLAERRGVPRSAFVAYTAGLTPELQIMDLLDAQPEFTKSLWEYLDILV